MTAHDSGWRWWLAFFLLPDFHRLHWHQFAWRTVISHFSATDPLIMSMKRIAFDVFGVAAAAEPFRGEIGLAAQLHDALRQLIGVHLLLVGMLQKLLRHALGVDSRRHEVVALVT